MKILHRIINSTCYTFAVLSLVFAILCKTKVLINLPYTEVFFPLFFMSIATSAWVLLREILFPNAENSKYIIELMGCVVIILISLHVAGWLELSFSYLILIFSMVLVVYLGVWLVDWLQSKHDEKDLNNLLQKQKDKNTK